MAKPGELVFLMVLGIAITIGMALTATGKESEKVRRVAKGSVVESSIRTDSHFSLHSEVCACR